MGYEKKLSDICEKSGLHNLDKQEIETINKIRQKFSHGGVDNADIGKYGNLNTKLNEMIIAVIKKEIEKNLISELT
ncbi:MAG: hypothetical protein Ta2F_08320 [Termitinemataceae bacterium]|nr:MAG: hypothetical protein Ta2F_08320 [Termitinemataceae bacterium]